MVFTLLLPHALEVVRDQLNRPVGCLRGESDLAPVLPWLRRYSRWLEDRVRRGFLDGSHGFVIALMSAYGAYLKYAKLWEMYRRQRRDFHETPDA